MKIALITLSILIIATLIYFFILGVNSRTGHAPGLSKGRLSACPDKPNCACSEEETAATHYIAPIPITENKAFDLTMIKTTIQGMSGIIQSETKEYIAASFSSNLFGYIDDLEIRIDTEQHLIHLRSASRVGHSDMGVNKQRIALFKQRLKNLLSEKNR